MTKLEAIAEMKKLVTEGDTIHCSIGSVAKSGMSRRIKFYIAKDSEILSATYLASILYGGNLNDKGVLVKGCGMDMGFHVVYTLSTILFGNGYKLKSQWL